MKAQLLTTISFFACQLSTAQTEKLLHGKVFSEKEILKNVEVINKTSKTVTTTNELGEFSIPVKVKDSLLFFSKDYFFTRLKITQQNIVQNNMVVNMMVRPEELNEILIRTVEFDKVKYDPEAINAINTLKKANDLTRFIPGYKDGTIPNPMSLTIPFGIGNAKKKEKTKTDFKKLLANSCPPDFFTKDLKLNADRVDLFIEYCDADPRAIKLLENSNILATMDFLYAKNEEFKKLEVEPKN